MTPQSVNPGGSKSGSGHRPSENNGNGLEKPTHKERREPEQKGGPDNREP